MILTVQTGVSQYYGMLRGNSEPHDGPDSLDTRIIYLSRFIFMSLAHDQCDADGPRGRAARLFRSSASL